MARENPTLPDKNPVLPLSTLASLLTLHADLRDWEPGTVELQSLGAGEVVREPVLQPAGGLFRRLGARVASRDVEQDDDTARSADRRDGHPLVGTQRQGSAAQANV